MPSLPREPVDGQPLTPAWGRMLQRAVKELLGPRTPGAGVAAVPRRASGAAVVRQPFDLFLADAGGGNSTATIWPGTLNQLLVSNYATGVTVPQTGTRYLVVDCTTADGEITSAALAADSTAPGAIAPTQGTPPVAFKLLVGIVVDNVAYKVWTAGNVLASPVESFRVDKASPVPGSLPYDIYYTWELTGA